jgi:AcrR family transcriptional regulator
MPEAPKTPPKKKRGRPRKGAAGAPETEERLLHAAAAAFGQLGYERTRLKDIADAAGITRPSLLHHFESKSALYSATLRHSFATLEREVGAALSRQGCYEERVPQLIETLVRFDESHRAMVGTIFRGVLRDDDIAQDEVRRAFIPLVDAMEAYVRAAGGERFGPHYPVRAAILSLIANQLTHSGMGSFGEELYRGGAETEALGRALLVMA